MKKNVLMIVCGLFLMLLMTSYMYGYGTATGTLITNAKNSANNVVDSPGESILQYDNAISVTKYTQEPNITVSTVANGYDMSVMLLPSDQNGYASANADYTYSITNWGNVSDTISIIVAESNHTGGFTNLYSIITNGTVAAGPGTTASWTTPALAANASIDYTIRVTIPSPSVDGTWNTCGVTNKDTGGAGTGDGWPTARAIAPATSDVANARDTQYDTITTTVAGPLLVLSKDVTNLGLDPNQPRPYELLQYTSTYSNKGSSYATNVYLIDYVPSSTRYFTNSAEDYNTAHAGSITVEYYWQTDWSNSGVDDLYDVTNIKMIRWSFSTNVASTQKGTLKYKVLVE